MKQVNKLGVALLLAGVVWGCGTSEGAEEGAAELTTVTVGRGNLRITAEAVGSVEPVRRVEVKSKASGEVLRLYVEVGDVVEPGTLLAEVDPRDVKNRYDQAVADLEVSTAQASNAQANYQRSQELHRAGVITDQELESSRLSATNAQAGLTRATTNKQLAELQLSDVTIRAPMAGTILQKNVEEGSVIQSASQNVSGGTALFVMASLGEMQVRTMIDETDIGQLRAGLQTNVRVQAHQDKVFQGFVEQIQPQAVVQQNVTKFPVIISLDNSEGLLKPGMNAEVEVLIDQASGVLLLDNAAIVTTTDALAATLAMGLDESALDGIPMTGALNRVSDDSPGGEGGGRPAGGEQVAAAPEGGRGGGEGQAAGGDGQGRQGGGGGEGGAARQGQGGGGGGRGGQGGGQGGQGGAAGAQGEFREFRTNAVNARGGGRGGGGGGRGGAGRRQAVGVGVGAIGEAGTVRVIRRAVVFLVDSAGAVAPRAIDIGLSDWVRTEIVGGLEEGDKVALVGAAQLQQQQQQLNRGGAFSPIPIPGAGGFRGGGPGGGGGGPGGGGGGGGRGGQ